MPAAPFLSWIPRDSLPNLNVRPCRLPLEGITSGHEPDEGREICRCAPGFVGRRGGETLEGTGGWNTSLRRHSTGETRALPSWSSHESGRQRSEKGGRVVLRDFRTARRQKTQIRDSPCFRLVCNLQEKRGFLHRSSLNEEILDRCKMGLESGT